MGPGSAPLTPPLAFTAGQWAVILSVLVAGLVLHAALVLWLYRDVRATGKDPRWWTAVAALAYVPTVIAWHFVRPKPVRAIPMPRPDAVSLDAPPAGTAEPPGDPYRLGVGHEPGERPSHATVSEAMQERSWGTVASMQRISCPRCAARFEATRGPEGPTRVVCPGCGAVGHV